MRIGHWFPVILILMSSAMALANPWRCEDLFHQSPLSGELSLENQLKKLKEADEVDDLEQMITSADRILALDSQNTYALRKKAKALIRRGQLFEAEPITATLLAIDPNDIRTLHMAAQIQLRLFRMEAALTHLKQLMSVQPTHTTTVGMTAYALFKLNRFEEALPLLQLRLQLDPNNTKALIMLAQTLSKLKRDAEVDEVALKLLSRDPENYTMLLVQLESLQRLEDHRGVVRTANKILLIDPTNPYIYGVKARSLTKQGKYTEALTAIDARLQLEPESGYAASMKVQVLLKLERYDQAEINVERIENGFHKSYFRAQILIGRKKFSPAIELLKTLDSGLNVKWLLARAYYSSGDMRNARSNLLFIVQHSKVLRPRVVAALVKIQLSGEQTALDPMLSVLTEKLPPETLTRVLAYKEALFWDYEPVAQVSDVSISNSFWEGLNARPVNGQTFHSTY